MCTRKLRFHIHEGLELQIGSSSARGAKVTPASRFESLPDNYTYADP